jgi:hypothetical protein
MRVLVAGGVRPDLPCFNIPLNEAERYDPGSNPEQLFLSIMGGGGDCLACSFADFAR